MGARRLDILAIRDPHDLPTILHLCAMMVVSHRFYWYKTQKELVMPTVDPNAVILTGENPFIRLSATDGGPNTTEASFWRITFSPGWTRARSLSQERAH